MPKLIIQLCDKILLMPNDKNNRFFKNSMNEWVFNQAIYDEREANGFSQEEMGRLLKVSCKVISKYELKQCKPSLDVVIEFMKVFNKKIFIVDRFEDVSEFDFIANTESRFKN
jgi:transcriptional regulator with XRE-family HTH domain